MIKILIINTVKFHINGMSNVIIDFYQNMNRDGMTFNFIVNEDIDKKYEQIIRESGADIFILKNRNRSPFAYIQKLSEIITKNNYDVVHIHGNSALMSIEIKAVRKSGSKAKIVVHAHNTECKHPFLNQMLYGYFKKNYDYAVACSNAAGKWLYQNQPYTVINNGIDEQRFRYQPELRETCRKENHLQDKFVMTHVGRFNKQKNHVFLLEIFKAVYRRNQNAVLRLVGTGGLEQEIRQLVQNSEIAEHVIFAGVTDKVEIEYQMADVFILPSLYESFGLVNVEAQCAGLPCVISDTVPKEIKITEHVKFLSLQDSPEKWAETVLSFKGILRESHHEEVISHHYSIHHEAQKLSGFYRNIAENKVKQD